MKKNKEELISYMDPGIINLSGPMSWADARKLRRVFFGLQKVEFRFTGVILQAGFGDHPQFSIQASGGPITVRRVK